MSRIVNGVVLSEHPVRIRHEVEDLKGRVFGELTVIEFDHKDKYCRAVWQCHCSCGKECMVPARHLKSGAIISCGHVNRAKASKRMSKLNYKHGASNENWFLNYVGMLMRVQNPKGSDAKYYNHNWIDGPLIDPSWEKDPWKFFKEIGEKPGDSYTVDRIDTHRGYVPGNVRWATKEQQSVNRDYRKSKGTYQGIIVQRKGVNRRARDRYMATITVNHHTVNLGTYLLINNAKRARYDAETKYNFPHTFVRPVGPMEVENDPAKSDHPNITRNNKRNSWDVCYPIYHNGKLVKRKYIDRCDTLDQAKLVYAKADVAFKRDPEAFLNSYKINVSGIVAIDPGGNRYYYKGVTDFQRQNHSNANIWRRLKDGKPFTRKRSKFYGWRFEYANKDDMSNN